MVRILHLIGSKGSRKFAHLARGGLKRQGRERGFWPTALKAEFFARALSDDALQLAGFSCKHFLWFFGRGISSSFFEEIRAGRVVGGIQMPGVFKALNSGNN